MMHWGALHSCSLVILIKSIYVAGGNPYGTSVTIDQDGKMIEDVKEAVKHQAKRTVMVAEWIKKGSK